MRSAVLRNGWGGQVHGKGRVQSLGWGDDKGERVGEGTMIMIASQALPLQGYNGLYNYSWRHPYNATWSHGLASSWRD